MIKLLKSLSSYYFNYKVYVDGYYYGSFLSIGKIGEYILASIHHSDINGFYINLEDTPFETIIIKIEDKMENGALTIKIGDKDDNSLHLDAHKMDMRVFIHVDGHDYELMDVFRADKVMKKRHNESDIWPGFYCRSGIYASGLSFKDPVYLGDETMMPHDIVKAIQKIKKDKEKKRVIEDFKDRPVIGQLGVYSHKGWKNLTDKEVQQILKRMS